MPVILARELAVFGLDIQPELFRDLIQEVHAVCHPAWTIDELVCHPRDAKRYCNVVRGRLACADLPDDLRAKVAGSLGLIGLAKRKFHDLYAVLGEELAQAAAEDALLSAVKRYDPDRAEWSTYAVSYIFGFWQKTLRELAARRRLVARSLPAEDLVPGKAAVEPVLGLDPEHTREIAAALKTLPRQQRRAVEMCILQGLTLTAAARLMSVSKSAVQQYRDMGLLKLKKRFLKWESVFFSTGGGA